MKTFAILAVLAIAASAAPVTPSTVVPADLVNSESGLLKSLPIIGKTGSGGGANAIEDILRRQAKSGDPDVQPPGGPDRPPIQPPADGGISGRGVADEAVADVTIDIDIPNTTVDDDDEFHISSRQVKDGTPDANPINDGVPDIGPPFQPPPVQSPSDGISN